MFNKRLFIVGFIPLLTLTLFLIRFHESVPQINLDFSVRWRDNEEESGSGGGGGMDVMDISRSSSPSTRDQFDTRNFVLGEPTAHFRDNIHPKGRYITGFVGGGYTNDFMTYIHLIMIGQMSRRTPIIPPFEPSHIGWNETTIPFGDVFNLTRASSELSMGLLEWRDVKLNVDDGPEWDEIGCWTIWSMFSGEPRPGMSRDNRVWRKLGLDVSYTRTPEWTLLRGVSHSAWALAALGFPRWHQDGTWQNRPMVSEGPKTHFTEPDQQLLCYDFLYYVGVVAEHEWDEDYSPQWQVATKFRWSDRMMEIANGYLRRLFKVDRDEDIPKFVSIHVRHGDFRNLCTPERSIMTECFASIPVIARRVSEVQHDIQLKWPGINDGQPLPVLLTSDERDSKWWDDVRNQGWYFIDHSSQGENTVERFGKWYPPLLDSLFQSLGHGFVGTEGSTMSVVARRRVVDWQGGPTILFKWGFPGADDH